MEDIDIKILKERIEYCKYQPEGCNWQLSFEYSEIPQVENILNRLEQLEKELEPIRELGIPVKTAVAELNRLEDLEDDREQMQLIINELRKENEQHKQLNVGIMTDLINDFIPKSVIKEKIEELEQQTSTINDKAISKKYSHTQFARECCIGMLKELLGGSNE